MCYTFENVRDGRKSKNVCPVSSWLFYHGSALKGIVTDKSIGISH